MKDKKRYKLLGSKLFLVGVLVGICFVSFNIAREMYKAYQIEQEVSEMDSEIDSLKSERVTLNEDLAYLQTKSFKELEYRTRSNSIRPDEEVWVLNNVDEEEVLDEETVERVDPEEINKKDDPKENWKLWWENFIN